MIFEKEPCQCTISMNENLNKNLMCNVDPKYKIDHDVMRTGKFLQKRT